MRALAWLALFIWANPGFAWGPEGHRLVARMAQDLLTPAAAAQVQATLGPEQSLAGVSSWADEVRNTRKETEPWHYINIPISGSGLDMTRDCPAAGCVVSKIKEFRAEWRDASLAPERRREALLFLVHFVGDMHEPLHCSDNHDHGGNQTFVEFEGARTSLHRLWDAGLMQRMPSEDQLFATMEKAITPGERAEWSRGSVEDWAEESFEVARRLVYGELPPPAGTDSLRIGEAYEHAAEPVIEVQLEKAAVRLAAILNEAP